LEQQEAVGTYRGSVKWFDASRGFGFISPDSGGKDIFVYWESILMDGYKTLPEHARVEYTIGTGKKGPEAFNVREL
jgi:cold shock protein